ncbi:hypothetical protein CBR_g26001 [Chara braunii]|uniref:Reverse transcriptase domain-containing protein n=1 Tax=Chara braunii TaxID=69332 RepID=A0A388L705_CHABU|nr:hypothetical protein CBR_g26001 [Chara braunii]|eukprot:GBG78064.1 hypothetical protein CBR_g26001 [Chara braunii]
MRDAEAREARLEAHLIRLLAQHNKPSMQPESSNVKKKSPRTKARVLREITSYLNESDDESEEVREEAGKLVEAIERRKGKRRIYKDDGKGSRIQSERMGYRVDLVRVEDDDEEKTPPPAKRRHEEESGILKFAIELHKHLSEKKEMEQLRVEMIAWRRVVEEKGGRLKASEEDRLFRLFLLCVMSGECPWARKWVGIVSGNDGDVSTANPGVHAIVSPWCRHFYIGCTSRAVITRWADHVSQVVRGNPRNAPRLHAWLRVFGWHKYLAVPLVDGIEDLLVVESSFIRRFSPALNTRGLGGERWRGKKKRVGKRERGKRQSNPSGVVVNKFNGKASVIDVLRDMRCEMSLQWIASSGGSVWIDRWKVARRKVGETPIWVGEEERPIKECKQCLEKGGKFRVWKIRILPSSIEHRRFVLRDVLRLSWRIQILYKKASRELVALYRTTMLFSKKKSRNRAKCVVARVVRGKYGYDIRRRSCVRFPFPPSVKRGMVRRVAAGVSLQAVADPDLARFIAGKVRVVERKRTTVGTVIHNHRKFADSLDVGSACEGLQLPRTDEHVKVRLDEVEGVPSFMWNSKNVTSGCVLSMEGLSACIMEGVKGWRRGKKMRLSHEDVGGCFDERMGGRSAAMSTNEVRRYSRRFSGMVAVLIDRNPGATLIVCPALYFRACLETFNLSGSFRKMQESSIFVMTEMTREYGHQGLDKIARWQTGDTCFFGIPKTVHFDLKSSDNLGEQMKVFERDLNAEGDCVITRSYDVKDMFARLSHESVMEVVEWLTEYHKQKGLKGVRVSTRGKMCSMIKKVRKEEGFINMSFEDIRREVSFELSHSFICCAGEVMRQEFGIPMGRSFSPALACTVCARAEYVCMNRMKSTVAVIRGLRMIDDVAIMVGCRTDRPNIFGRASRILSEFEQCHDRNIKLVRKDEGGNVFDFLGTRVLPM